MKRVIIIIPKAKQAEANEWARANHGESYASLFGAGLGPSGPTIPDVVTHYACNVKDDDETIDALISEFSSGWGAHIQLGTTDRENHNPTLKKGRDVIKGQGLAGVSL